MTSPSDKAQNQPKQPGSDLRETRMGTTVVGERGQVVIPKEIRDRLNLQPGTTLMVMNHDEKGPIILFPLEHMREFVAKMSEHISDVSSNV